MRLVDLHVHSTCSADGISSITDHARRAIVMGLTELAFCEHVDFDRRDPDYGFFDVVRYDRELAAARAQVSGIRLHQGVEVTYQSGLDHEIRTWLARHPWDYVVVSVHMIDYADGWAMISEPRTARAYFASHTQQQAYTSYFQELLRAVHSGLGDIVGHVDLVKRYGVAYYGPFQPAAVEDEIRAVLQAAIDRGMGLEINTSGSRQSPGEPYPNPTILRWYRQMGGEILAVGSDAHAAGDLGLGVADAMDLARALGFRAIAAFEARQLRWIDL